MRLSLLQAHHRILYSERGQRAADCCELQGLSLWVLSWPDLEIFGWSDRLTSFPHDENRSAGCASSTLWLRVWDCSAWWRGWIGQGGWKLNALSFVTNGRLAWAFLASLISRYLFWASYRYGNGTCELMNRFQKWFVYEVSFSKSIASYFLLCLVSVLWIEQFYGLRESTQLGITSSLFSGDRFRHQQPERRCLDCTIRRYTLNWYGTLLAVALPQSNIDRICCTWNPKRLLDEADDDLKVNERGKLRKETK